MTQIDKAGKNYWDNNWVKTDFPAPFNYKDKSLNNFVNLEFHKFFQNLFGSRKNFSILEIGCANSIWPVYFNQYFHAEVSGLDYSEIGCEKSRALLKNYNIPAKIYCADLFSPPVEMLEKFDVVVSFGVVEHFEDTAACLKSCASFVKPGGMLLTFIPNIPSIIGFIQKYIDRAVYDVHVPLTKKMLKAAHQDAALDLQNCDYLMSINLNIVNSGAFSSHPLNSFLRHALSVISKIFWILEKFFIKLPKNSFTSPYLISVARIQS